MSSDSHDLTAGYEAYERKEEERRDLASDYLQTTLGSTLTEVLVDCANTRPDDPVAFLADALEKKASAKTKGGSAKNDDRQARNKDSTGMSGKAEEEKNKEQRSREH